MSRLEEIRETIEMLLEADAWCSSERSAVEDLINQDGLWLISQGEEAEKLRGAIPILRALIDMGCADNLVVVNAEDACGNCASCNAYKILVELGEWEQEDRQQKETKDGEGKGCDST